MKLNCHVLLVMNYCYHLFFLRVLVVITVAILTWARGTEIF